MALVSVSAELKEGEARSGVLEAVSEKGAVLVEDCKAHATMIPIHRLGSDQLF